ncbi:hypothetical protein [Paenibacillus sp. MBLB4367]|uniref:hypothetical protein n=1 Tax=Paenibacillus sp. MBLB4367 TaxID=3384767 RepID=UPI003908401D
MKTQLLKLLLIAAVSLTVAAFAADRPIDPQRDSAGTHYRDPNPMKANAEQYKRIQPAGAR